MFQAISLLWISSFVSMFVVIRLYSNILSFGSLWEFYVSIVFSLLDSEEMTTFPLMLSNFFLTSFVLDIVVVVVIVNVLVHIVIFFFKFTLIHCWHSIFFNRDYLNRIYHFYTKIETFLVFFKFLDVGYV